MAIYQFHFFDADGRRPTLDFFEGDSDGDASRAAFRCLTQHLSCTGVEVFDGERLVVRVERPAGEAASFAPTMHGLN